MAPDPPLKTALPASVDGETRVLLLGSLPGERSLMAGEYYAHPSNAFWWLMGEVLGEAGLPRLAYAERLACLRVHRVGLWDVIASARRQGSLDGAIRDATHRDLVAFAGRLPHLRAIGFNGGAAAQRGRRQLASLAGGGIALVDLPSSSAAHAGMTREGKLAAWRAIEPYLR
ncbi:DNA-deoxyinosine glycosylase [Novosphingobium sp. BL-52-GroH]|uniref:DNA-deoxyinosine glycosylase n=1 Tax=Novosphingobium sp. BL-52-GroH TaxID=3349877 RepID=UPI00384B9965